MSCRTSVVFSFMLMFILNLSVCSEAASPKFKEMQDFWGNTFGWQPPQDIPNQGRTPSSKSVSGLKTAKDVIPPGPFATTRWNLLAKAPPDECYYGMGNPGNGPSSAGNLPACTGGQPKVNQAYVWGLVKNGPRLWLGTIANTHCLVMGAYLGLSIPMEDLSWVCEFGAPPGSNPFGDFRTPRVYTYDTATDTLTDKTALILAAGAPHTNRLNSTIGLRSAGSIGDLVILAGPGFGGINLFAFNGTTGTFIGSTTLPAFNDIRKWLVVDGVLYTTVSDSSGGGSVLRWTGTVASPFTYDIVGNLDTMGAELALHEGRLFVATWPSFFGPTALAGLWMSPSIPGGGLTNAHAAGWTKVWEADDYEPDPTVAATYAGGALHSHDGYLYWGTMHIPFLATIVALGSLDLDADGSSSVDTDELLTTALGTYRAINIFRGRNFATTPQLEVLYGLQYLPVYDPSVKQYTIALDPLHQNKMPDPVPKWGLPGFGNFFNVYTWSMAEYNGRLYIGTFDWSYLLAQGFLGIYFDSLAIPPPPPAQAQIIANLYSLLQQNQVQFPWYVWGADLYRIGSSAGPAQPEDVAGVGNFTNYGIRNMIHGSGLYLGMANPMNLLTFPSPNDPNNVLPEGGWELIGLEASVTPVPTLTEWGMILFIILAGLGSVYYLRRQGRV